MKAVQAKKKYIAEDVYALAMDRLRLCFDRFDKVVVSFSGGKDSTACFQLALQVAREMNRLPLDVFTFDEEAIPPETVEYMERVRQNPDIRFHWYCLPVEHRNACSRKHPYWYPWDPDQRELWVRDLPAGAITELAGFDRHPPPEIIGFMFGPQCGRVCQVMGIRTQESMSRYSMIARKRGREAFLVGQDYHNQKHVTKAFPIYDWMTEDVWVAPQKFGWDYNRAYDVMEAAGLARLEARCSPPYGEQPIRRLWAYKVCWPELWARMLTRVPGAATAARYANTELYGVGKIELDDGQSWQAQTLQVIAKLQPSAQKEVGSSLAKFLNQHHRYTNDALPDAIPHPLSGFCWKEFYRMAQAGGDKFGRLSLKIVNRGIAARKKAGVPSVPRATKRPRRN